MQSLDRRLAALETVHGAGELILVSWLPTDGMPETASYDGTTYTQATDETRAQFRSRVAALNPNGQKYIWVAEMQPAA